MKTFSLSRFNLISLCQVLVVALLLLSFSPPSYAVNQEALEKVVKSYGIPKDRLGLYVVDLNEIPNKVVFSLNGDKLMVPASLSKILTAITALKRFGPSYRLQTNLWTSAKIEGKTLKGDLILKGGGDPGFVSESMWFLVNEFTRNQITKIEGDIVVDDTYFDSVRFDESRDPGRVDRAYDAPIGAMSFNWNSINVHVRPTTPGKAPLIFLNPENEEWTGINKATTKKGAGDSILVSRVDANNIFVTGSIGVAAKETVKFKSILNPAIWSGNNLKEFLRQRGITVSGKIKLGKTPSDARMVANAEGKPMSDVVKDMMKFSNNYVAEMLTKNLAAKYKKTPATLADGVAVINETVIDIGLKPDQFSFINPSGLSRKNKIRPKDMTMLLSEAYASFSYGAELLSSLPLGGVDGTLKSRFLNSKATGRIRAKTGMLTGVAGLAGFASQKNGRTYSFTFIFNGPGEQGDLARRLFDDIATNLVQ